MTLTQRAQATAAALFFGFVSIFALGVATGTPAQAEWGIEIKAAHEVHVIEALDVSDAITAPLAMRTCAAAKAAAAADIEI